MCFLCPTSVRVTFPAYAPGKIQVSSTEPTWKKYPRTKSGGAVQINGAKVSPDPPSAAASRDQSDSGTAVRGRDPGAFFEALHDVSVGLLPPPVLRIYKCHSAMRVGRQPEAFSFRVKSLRCGCRPSCDEIPPPPSLPPPVRPRTYK